MSDPLINSFAGKRSNVGELPGAALLCHSFVLKDLKSQGAPRVRSRSIKF